MEQLCCLCLSAGQVGKCSCFFVIWSGKKLLIDLFGQMLTVGIKNMAVYVRDHITDSVSGVALNAFNIALAYLEFDTCAAMSKRMKDDRAEIKVSVELFQFAVDLPRFIRTAVILCNDQIVVLIFIGQVIL